jgi:acetyl-CoA carboxylase biotin carboxyl carrier protein
MAFGEAAPATESSRTHPITAPLTGIWYESRTQGGPPFVKKGDVVEKGTVIGLIETMKVFNEVASDAEGVVDDIFVQKGDLVTVGSTIMTIDKSATPQDQVLA